MQSARFRAFGIAEPSLLGESSSQSSIATSAIDKRKIIAAQGSQETSEG
ncbi:hypothetical protein JHL17_08365 [Azospirillum sp. YIM B02556]|uniref:Uncharacterized protein n=1 Tax=Azospirillum endophyticum TaxID=2800326 RepID=A0ABS1F1Z7_9PROT|nr:hypothetical protein [Azospirillum endophyticum]MBK1837427.1 hypothetical protein [Azospirillum endophyticum]